MVLAKIGEHIEKHTQQKHTKHTKHTTENYFEILLTLLAKKLDGDLYLEAGNVSYPFQYLLPYNLPTSFEHDVGRVRYEIDATIDIPW